MRQSWIDEVAIFLLLIVPSISMQRACSGSAKLRKDGDNGADHMLRRLL